ncbi:MAG: 50S ribosomal protein L10 [Mariprofundales bacterium]
MNRAEKEQVVDFLRKEWAQDVVGIVVHYRGLTMVEISELRISIRAANGKLNVVKNTLAKQAIIDSSFAAANDLFSGPVAVISGADPAALAKVLVAFSKEHQNLVIQGGILEGKLLDVAGVKALTSLPSREELLAMLLRGMQAPITGFVRVLAEVPASFVRVLGAVRDQRDAS